MSMGPPVSQRSCASTVPETSQASHEVQEIPLHVWTRDGHLLEEFEARVLDRELFESVGQQLVETGLTGPLDGLLCVPTANKTMQQIPWVVRPAGIKCNFAPSDVQRAGARLEHCERVIGRFLEGPVIFKIGITTNPVWRWSEYQKENIYDRMVLLDFSTLEGWTPMLEAALIRTPPALRLDPPTYQYLI